MILYKYLGRDQFFENFKIRITQPSELNDPRECVPDIRFRDPRGYMNALIQRNFESTYLQLRLDNPTWSDEQALEACLTASHKVIGDFNTNNSTWIRRHYDKFMEVTNRNVGVLSLTESNNNELMWSHYANSHNGFVVAFDCDNAFFKPGKSDPRLCGELMNVQYTDEIPVVFVEPGNIDIPKEIFFTKTMKWSYEREWRMVKMLSSADETVNTNVHLFSVPPGAIKEVTFGMKIPTEKKEEIMSMLNKTAPHVTFTEAQLDHAGNFFVA